MQMTVLKINLYKVNTRLKGLPSTFRKNKSNFLKKHQQFFQARKQKVFYFHMFEVAVAEALSEVFKYVLLFFDW